MSKNGSDLVLCAVVGLTAGFFFLCNLLAVHHEVFQAPNAKEYGWVLKGALNLLGYSTILIPGFLAYKYVRRTNYLDRSSSGGLIKIVRKCFGEDELLEKPNAAQTGQRTTVQTAFLLMFYFAGLQVSFLSWGILQEKIMTQKYVSSEGKEARFRDSQFLVFVNRVLAFFMSGAVVLCSRQPRNRCPLYKYVFCSVSNILSSWCQYEALKYVSFPHQVLAKASKTIPVMIMGKIVSRTKYEYYEYLTASILSIGMLFFMLDTGHSNETNTTLSERNTTLSGLILLCIYIVFDSFTSNWQGALFKNFGMSPVQMMCGVNLFSCAFTAVSLLQQGAFIDSINFMIFYPRFVLDCVLLSFCSAAGQLFIFSTIATFGPLVFAIISTVRQGFAVFLSCLIFDHHIDVLGVFGVLLVFFSIFLRIYCSYRLKSIRKKVAHNALRI